MVARQADEGAIASPGQPLLRIVESDALEIRTGLPPRVAAQLVPGDAYAFQAGPRRITAQFRTSTAIVDRESRTVSAVFDLDPSAALAAGEIVRLAIGTPVGADGFWVPTEALAEGRRGLWSVYVLVPDEAGDYRLEPRVVETVRIEAERVFVRGAVADGDLVLASGLQRIAPGQRVIRTMATGARGR